MVEEVLFEREHGVQGVGRILVVGNAKFHKRCCSFLRSGCAFLVSDCRHKNSIVEGSKKIAEPRDKPAATKTGSAQEFVETRISGCFLKNDEFCFCDRHALCLKQ